MAHSIICKISSSIHHNIHYTIMADEVTDFSNREQFVLRLRWVNESFEVSEDLIGLYSVDNISSNTLHLTVKDVLLHLNLNFTNCRGRCYDGASNMVGIRSGVATMILKEEPRAILTHCYGHFLQLAVCDTVKQIIVMQDALDTINEITKLLKYSPKRDTLFAKLKNELAPDTPGFVFCVQEGGLCELVHCRVYWIDNWKPLQELWEESLDTKLDLEIKSCIIGVKYQMETFSYFFVVSLGALIFGHSDNLSKTL